MKTFFILLFCCFLANIISYGQKSTQDSLKSRIKTPSMAANRLLSPRFNWKYPNSPNTKVSNGSGGGDHVAASGLCDNGDYVLGNIKVESNGAMVPSVIVQNNCNVAFGFPLIQAEVTHKLGWDHFQFRELQTMHSDLGGNHFAFNSYSKVPDPQIPNSTWTYPRITDDFVEEYPGKYGSSQFVQFADGAMGWYNGSFADTKGPIHSGIFLDPEQNFGVGTDNPEAKLHVAGSMRVGEINGGEGRLYVNGGQNYSTADGAGNTDELFFERFNKQANVSHLRINIGDDGINYAAGPAVLGAEEDKISIGSYSYTTGHPWNEAVALYSNGSIYARKVKVTLDAYPDYVFSPGYKIRSLEETEAYINANQHLPEMPSACEIEQNGADLGELHKSMLKQLEELTLQVIALKKEVEVLKKEK